ncbi:MAG: hypothetical protein DIU56_005660 [Pseudomonadota bacterium]|jgi:cytochrome c-type biogenesis protein CcmH
MTAFIILAALLALGVAALVAWPLLRRGAAGAPARGAAIAVVAIIAVGAALLYPTWSNYSWNEEPAADDPQRMVARLARRLEREPEDIDGWLMLGRSYAVLEQYPLAIRAFQRADRLSGGRNAEALVGLAEVLILQDESNLAGRAARLLEQALEIDPRSPRGLFYGAAAAMQRGELKVARDRFQALLDLNPPENVRPLLAQQIAALDAQLAQESSGGSAPASSGTPSPSTPAAARDASPAGQAASPILKVNVNVAPALREQVPESAPLFVIVRDPDRPGPPLAVKRLASRFPQSVEIGGADSMMGSTRFARGQQVLVIARVSRSGGATARSGDPFGEVRHTIGADGAIEILIDRLTP